MPTDPEWIAGTQADDIRRMREGDQDALQRLLASLLPRLKERAAAKLPQKLRARIGPDDVVQEVCRSVCAQLAQFRGNSMAELAKWVQTILDGVLVDLARRHSRQVRSVDREDRDPRAEALAHAIRRPRGKTDTSPTQAARRNELVEKVRKAIAALTPEYREVIELRYFEQLKMPEIAVRLEISRDAADGRLRRALKELGGLGRLLGRTAS